jgi:pyruvate carboxylase
VKHAFAIVNRLVGDIPKVTPSSKMVGDFAVFLVQNDLLRMREDFASSVEATRERVLSEGKRLDFPESVVQYFRGYLGNPPGGFPAELRRAVLKGLPVLTGRPSEGLPEFDFEAASRRIQERTGEPVAHRDVVSAALYPRVFDDHIAFAARCGDVSILPTPVYFYGLEPGQEVWVEIEPGKTLVISLEAMGEPDAAGAVSVYFKLNGQNRQVTVVDRSLAKPAEARRKADAAVPGQVAAPMPGRVIGVHCREGGVVQAGEPLLTLEAMKMETVVRAPMAGTVHEICTDLRAHVQAQDLLVVIDSEK